MMMLFVIFVFVGSLWWKACRHMWLHSIKPFFQIFTGFDVSVCGVHVSVSCVWYLCRCFI